MRQTVRVLLAGVSHFNEAIERSLAAESVEVVGYAPTLDEAIAMAEDLRPDVVIADATVIPAVSELTDSAPVVFLSPDVVEQTAADRAERPDADLDVVAAVLAVSVAQPDAPADHS